ncbi:MAG: AAA family ATPase [Muribaculaceae bacterium]|nr:AAA family ATPase [Muribaculaceae bacterium]
MDKKELLPLIENYHRKISKVNLRFLRYLYHKINWETRIISIRGARGVGKTTMLLQYILKNYENIDDTIYASLDDLWFADHSLIDLVDMVYKYGMKRIFLDEVHRYPHWAITLKNIYDSYPDFSIVYTSSSLLKIDNGQVDLSRRQTPYTLYGLSFREFLAYNEVYNFNPFPLDEILRHHPEISMEILSNIKIFPHFEEYLKRGYYPFYNEDPEDFVVRLRESINVVIENDLPAVEHVSFETIQKVRKLLMIISSNVPFQPKMSDLWGQLSTNNELGLKMLYALDRAQILSLLTSHIKNYKQLYKPDKIFLGNTSLMHALCLSINKGNERETFFNNQIQVYHKASYPLAGDFLIDDKYLFEVGGRNKTFEQIADVADSYLAIDDIETGFGNRIPLWLFGFLY